MSDVVQGFPQSHIVPGRMVIDTNFCKYQITCVSSAYNGYERLVVIHNLKTNTHEHMTIDKFCEVINTNSGRQARFRVYTN